MLIDFTVGNFRSFKEPQTFSMLATKLNKLTHNVFASKREEHIKLLKTSIIYGPNASGKSNLIRALKNVCDFINNSTNLKEEEKIPYYDPFKLDYNYIKQPASFEIEFIAEDLIRYQYSASFDAKKISKESLVFYPNKLKRLLFSREAGKPIKYGDALTGPKKNIEAQLLDNNLFFIQSCQ